jgi:type VI secretion system protein ImpA
MQARVVAVESIEAQSTVIMPLQFAPLLAHRRLGTVSYRNHLIATGVVTPRENEAVVDSSTIDKIVDEIEVGPLIEKRDEFAGLKGALGTILRVWSEKDTSGSSIQLDKVVDIVTKIVAFLDQAVARRDPSAALVPVQGGEAAADGAESETGEGATSGPVGPVTTLAEAAAALTAVAEYFGTREPSSPTLLLVRQASQLLGKSFVEVMRTLVPTHVEQAAINIGRTETFGLPIERLASLVGDGAGESQVTNGGDASGTELPQFNIQTRSQAMLLLDQVSAYFRTAEPSSPVPFLLERARDLGQRDFLSVLKALLPADALKSSGG